MNEPIANYILFAGEDYYPVGGWRDFIGRYETKEEAIDLAKSMLLRKYHPDTTNYSWYHVVNLLDGEFVATGRR